MQGRIANLAFSDCPQVKLGTFRTITIHIKVKCFLLAQGGGNKTVFSEQSDLKVGFLAIGMAPSYSKAPFGTGDYDDGEIKELRTGSSLWHALTGEPWLNWSLTEQFEWKLKMQRPLKFLGTVVSVPRQQIEVTLIYQDPAGNSTGMETVTVSLLDFHRFS